MAHVSTLKAADLHHDFGLGILPADKIRSVLANEATITRVTLFGLRAKGNFQSSSDIDLAVEGLQSDLKAEALRSALEALAIPQRFDVIALEKDKHPPIVDHIPRVGVVVYEAQG